MPAKRLCCGSATRRSRGRGPGSRWRGWCTGAAGYSGGPGPADRGVGDVGEGLLALAGSVEHLLGEGALLSNQVLGEAEHRVKDQLGFPGASPAERERPTPFNSSLLR
jgi:hypothetical protein